VAGEQAAFGDSEVGFCIQSCCKPINYAFALEELGEEQVHRYIGREPSGRRFNELTLDEDGRPHNPMVNAGAIVCCSLLFAGKDPAERFELVMERWAALAGGERAGFSNAIYQSERQTADRNYAIGYMLRERKAFPAGANLIENLEFYFQCCAIEQNCRRLAVVAATLANGGICPKSQERVLSSRSVRNTLCLMSSCGLYDFSGEFAFTVGLPAKSGVSGVIMLVAPGRFGLSIWSPKVDRVGNSVRGVELCRRIAEHFQLHQFDL
jgi:glutaminase